MPSRRFRMLLTIIGVLVLLRGVSDSHSALAQTGGCQFKAHSLVAASLEEIRHVAQTYTCARFTILSGVPQIVAMRHVTASDLPTLGLSLIGFAGDEPPLLLVILKGDFDISALRGGLLRAGARQVNDHVEYIAYVFDRRAGVPTLIQTSKHGGIFRTVLHDPTLPADSPNQSTPAGPALPPLRELPHQKLPYGTSAPAAAIPTPQ